VSLGFFLSRAAASDPGQRVSRRVWGESVFRGCLAAELARELCPAYGPEAFIVGLLMDAGIPLAHKLIGAPYAKVLSKAGSSPLGLFEAESRTLPFTHVDVMTALTNRWRLPELLARPIHRHHAAPRAGGRDNIVHQLQRVAFYAGAVELGAEHTPQDASPDSEVAERMLGLDRERLAEAVRRATSEYAAIYDVFRGVAEEIGGIDQMAASVHSQLITVTDRMILGQLSKAAPSSGYFEVCGHRLEVEVDQSGRAVAYLSDQTGRRLLSYAFKPGELSAHGVLEGLGLDPGAGEADHLETYLRSIAA
jgi:hypothetical protein